MSSLPNGSANVRGEFIFKNKNYFLFIVSGFRYLDNRASRLRAEKLAEKPQKQTSAWVSNTSIYDIATCPAELVSILRPMPQPVLEDLENLNLAIRRACLHCIHDRTVVFRPVESRALRPREPLRQPAPYGALPPIGSVSVLCPAIWRRKPDRSGRRLWERMATNQTIRIKKPALWTST